MLIYVSSRVHVRVIWWIEVCLCRSLVKDHIDTVQPRALLKSLSVPFAASRHFKDPQWDKTDLEVLLLLTLKESMQTRQCRMTRKGLLTYSGVEVIVFHTSFRAQMVTLYLSLHGFVFSKCSSRFTENICTICAIFKRW